VEGEKTPSVIKKVPVKEEGRKTQMVSRGAEKWIRRKKKRRGGGHWESGKGVIAFEKEKHGRHSSQRWKTVLRHQRRTSRGRIGGKQ